MKKMIIIGLSLLMTACSMGSYDAKVTTDTYKEDFKIAQIDQPAVDLQNDVQTSDVQLVPVAKTQNMVQIVPPSSTATSSQSGYTIQVAALGMESQISQFATPLLNSNQPVWKNYKVVNGVKWYTILYGDFASRQQAEAAIRRLPQSHQALRPFVKSFNEIKRSAYPTLTKLN